MSTGKYQPEVLAKQQPGVKDQPVPPGWFVGRKEHFQWRDLEKSASLYQLDDALREAVNTALGLGEPLLVTGEPGIGKTQLAYYLAWKLRAGDVERFQVKSNSLARDLIYQFDEVKYFHSARVNTAGDIQQMPDKKRFVVEGELWRALNADHPRVVLIDEIDKAPRDFPNDLLRELDEYRWKVLETDEKHGLQLDKLDHKPVVLITSNDERQLPDAFLRRCLHYRIQYTPELLRKVVEARRAEFSNLSESLIGLALERFEGLRKKAEAAGQRKPSIAEALVWMRALNLFGVTQKDLEKSVKQVPHLALLLKTEAELKAQGL